MASASEQLTALFAQAERKQAILDAISRPAERVKPWSEYRPIFITDARIDKGLAFWEQHAETLARAEQSYGVPAQVIVAIIGVETFYGRQYRQLARARRAVDPVFRLPAALTVLLSAAQGVPPPGP